MRCLLFPETTKLSIFICTITKAMYHAHLLPLINIPCPNSSHDPLHQPKMSSHRDRIRAATAVIDAENMQPYQDLANLLGGAEAAWRLARQQQAGIRSAQARLNSRDPFERAWVADYDYERDLARALTAAQRMEAHQLRRMNTIRETMRLPQLDRNGNAITRSTREHEKRDP